MKRIDSGYKLIEVLLSGGRGSADTVVNVTTVEFRFGAVILIEKLVYNVAFESPYGGQFILSTQLIKPNYLVILPTGDAAPQFL